MVQKDYNGRTCTCTWARVRSEIFVIHFKLCLHIILLSLLQPASFYLFFLVTITGKEHERYLLLRPAFLPVPMQRQRRPEITAGLHYAFGDFEAGLCSGARVRRPTNELPCTLLLGLMTLTTTPRDVCCSPWPDGLGGSDPPQQPGSSRPLLWCAALTGARGRAGQATALHLSLSFSSYTCIW